MASDWEKYLNRWVESELLDESSAARIRAFEAARNRSEGLRWPALLALALSAILFGAGVLLFVSAHWDTLSPLSRMALVLFMVAVFHVAGALTSARWDGLSIALHFVGTVSLGAGIALTGQIFNLEEHWPGAVLLWAVGAAVGWAMLRQWPQAALTALLGPAWLVSEWVGADKFDFRRDIQPAFAGICLLAVTYLAARAGQNDSALRRALGWIGGLGFLPSVCLVILENRYPESAAPIFAWMAAVAVPLGIAFLLRRHGAWCNAVAAAWIGILCLISAQRKDILVYIWCAVGSILLVLWGTSENRRERINLGMAGFGITLLVFYFSSVMDKLGRSMSLIGLGVLFLAGGWLLEKMRRRLIGNVKENFA